MTINIHHYYKLLFTTIITIKQGFHPKKTGSRRSFRGTQGPAATIAAAENSKAWTKELSWEAQKIEDGLISL